MMNPLNFFAMQSHGEDHAISIVRTSTDEDLNDTLCCSSLSDDNSETSEEETKRKVLERQYSRLAFSVSRMGKEDPADGETEHDIYSERPQSLPSEVDNSNMKSEKKQKVIDRKYSRLAFSIQQVGSEVRKSSH